MAVAAVLRLRKLPKRVRNLPTRVRKRSNARRKRQEVERRAQATGVKREKLAGRDAATARKLARAEAKAAQPKKPKERSAPEDEESKK
jgi:hypothetical protein